MLDQRRSGGAAANAHEDQFHPLTAVSERVR